MCFVRQQAILNSYRSVTEQNNFFFDQLCFCVVWLTQFCFCFLGGGFLSVPSVKMLYTQQGCDDNNPTVWLVLRCVCWTKKYALSAHYVKPRSKNSVQIKTSESEPVRCFFGLDKLMYRNNALLILSSLNFRGRSWGFLWWLFTNESQI